MDGLVPPECLRRGSSSLVEPDVPENCSFTQAFKDELIDGDLWELDFELDDCGAEFDIGARVEAVLSKLTGGNGQETES